MSGSISSDMPSDHLTSDHEENDDKDDNYSNEGAAEFEEEEDGVMEKGDLQKYYENTANFRDARLKLPFMYEIAASFENPSNLSESPYSHKKFGNKKKSFTLTIETLTLELL